MKPDDIQRAVVVGTGQMGPGIAYTLAAAGCAVTLYGRNQESLDRGLQSYRTAVETLIQARCITRDAGVAAVNGVAGATDLDAAAADADLVVESIVEDLHIKQDLFLRLEKVCPSHTILSSNTSGLPATQIASPLMEKSRFAVTHFWNPPHLMPLVEVVKGNGTSQETVDVLMALLRSAGKKPVAVLKDTPGQLGNRLFHALIREGIHIVQEGIATAEDVDTAAQNGFGRRLPVYGVLAHQDAVGLDMVYAIQRYMCPSLCNDTEAADLLRQKVESGDLGVKTGKGFIDWTKKDIRSVIQRRDRFLVELFKQDRIDSDE